MQKKSLETILYSAAGVIVMAVILIALNVITGTVPLRMDLTQEKAYTLSAGTKSVLKELKGLDGPIKIRFYCTQGGVSGPDAVYLRDYARKVEDLLHEYQQIAGKNLVIQKLDPEPDSDAEDSARLDGLEPQQLSTGDNFYLGLSISLADQHVAIPFLSPDLERRLEYDLTRAISQVLTPDKPVVGVMSSLPVFGGQANPMAMEQGQAPPPAWTIIDQLKQDYNVKPVEMDTDKIDDEVKVLVVIHPKDISDRAQYAIDQFVLRGGKLIAFLDPVSALSSKDQNPMMGGGGGPSSSSLDKLLTAWGIGFDTSKVVADMDFKMQIGGQDGQPSDAPAFLGLTQDGLNRDDVVTSEIDSLWLPLCGAFTGTPVVGLTETVLAHSSKDAELTDGMMAMMGEQQLMTSFKPTGTQYNLAIRLTGKFKTAFPEGEPKAASDTNSAPAAAGNSLKEAKADTSVVLVGDSDLLADDFSVEKLGPQVIARNGNLDFAQNLVEQMAGDNRLIGVRSRATTSRPFTRIKQLEAKAEETGEAKIAQLQQSEQDTEQRLSELQQKKTDKDQRLILSPEQQTEIENFQKQENEVKSELRQAQKDLRREVVSLETRLTWLNILAVPVLVALAGVTMALIKRKKTSAT